MTKPAAENAPASPPNARQTPGWKIFAWVALAAAMEASLPVESHFMHGASPHHRTICAVLVFTALIATGLALRFGTK